MPLTTLPELGSGANQVVVRLPDTLNVNLSPRTQAIVDHPAFQRLRQVRQLGPTCLVYPGAVHTRFEHSLGVFHQTTTYLRHLLAVPAFADRVQDTDLLTLLAAALLHDLGHYPMAHSLEALHHKGNDTPRHEDVAATLIRGELEPWRGEVSIATLLEDAWGVEPSRVIRFISGSRAQMNDTDALLASVISSGIDADKMDYLLRDSLHMGVPYGRHYDPQRLLDSLTVSEDGRSIAVTAKGKTPAEMFIFARYTMFSEAYWHKTVRSVSAMVEAALADLQARDLLPTHRDDLLHTLLSRSDDALLEHFAALAPSGSTAHRLLSGLVGHQRRLYKRILTMNRQSEDDRYARACACLMTLDTEGLKAMTEKLRETAQRVTGVALPEGALIIDTPPRDKDHIDDVDVIYTGRRVDRLRRVSAVVRAIAADFVRVVKKTRVFVTPDLAPSLRAHQDVLEDALLSTLLEAP